LKKSDLLSGGLGLHLIMHFLPWGGYRAFLSVQDAFRKYDLPVWGNESWCIVNWLVALVCFIQWISNEGQSQCELESANRIVEHTSELRLNRE